jgi:hypothetical protein
MLLGIIPPIIAIIILSLTGLIGFPILWKFLKSHSVIIRLGVISIAWLFLIGLSFYYYNETNKPEPKVLSSQSEIKNSFNSSQSNTDNSRTINNESGKNNNNQVTMNGPGIVQIGDSNQASMNIYNMPPQRHLNKSDLARLKAIPLRADKIRVLYPANNNEAAHYAEEIWNKLFDLGYQPYSKATYEKTSKPSAKRFDISAAEETEPILNITIHPQL